MFADRLVSITIRRLQRQKRQTHFRPTVNTPYCFLRHAPGQERRLDDAKLKAIIAAGRVFAVMSAAVGACIAANIELLLTALSRCQI
jgi:hypothetical protein